ncbi:uncharacterized protein LOC113468382 [Diaphorina citri]|uniref:Uncharacterized protein LOC113468382 n=1 Tax=Diaphorina citri TaxID=121845 RepID=A0A3Q0J257_DIACI|nr:uncharacterized protein LOC113468382 [Diaphorina citri]
MDKQVLVLTICLVVISIASNTVSEYCGIKMVSDQLKAVGYIANNKFSTSGSVCPDKCGGALLTEINKNCGATFQAKCIGQCHDKSKKEAYESCCLISGQNHKGEYNSYYFANVKGSQDISFVKYTGAIV